MRVPGEGNDDIPPLVALVDVAMGFSQLLERTGIDASRRAAGLGDRQRQALLDALK